MSQPSYFDRIGQNYQEPLGDDVRDTSNMQAALERAMSLCACGHEQSDHLGHAAIIGTVCTANQSCDSASFKWRKQMSSYTTLEELGSEVHEMAVRRGWWEQPLHERILRLCKWLHEEVDEIEKAWIMNEGTSWKSVDAEGLEKPEGVGSELADVYLIIQDIAHGLRDHGFDIDLPVDTREKLSYDQVRKYSRDKTGEPLGSGNANLIPS